MGKLPKGVMNVTHFSPVYDAISFLVRVDSKQDIIVQQ